MCVSVRKIILLLCNKPHNQDFFVILLYNPPFKIQREEKYVNIYSSESGIVSPGQSESGGCSFATASPPNPHTQP
jgi:hypothetical protein